MVLTRQACKQQGISPPSVLDLPLRKRQTKISAFFPVRTVNNTETFIHDPMTTEKSEVLNGYPNKLDWSVDYTWEKLIQPPYDGHQDLATEMAQVESSEHAVIWSGSILNADPIEGNKGQDKEHSLAGASDMTGEYDVPVHRTGAGEPVDEVSLAQASTLDKGTFDPEQGLLGPKEEPLEKSICLISKDLEAIKKILSGCHGLLTTMAEICMRSEGPACQNKFGGKDGDNQDENQDKVRKDENKKPRKVSKGKGKDIKVKKQPRLITEKPKNITTKGTMQKQGQHLKTFRKMNYQRLFKLLDNPEHNTSKTPTKEAVKRDIPQLNSASSEVIMNQTLRTDLKRTNNPVNNEDFTLQLEQHVRREVLAPNFGKPVASKEGTSVSGSTKWGLVLNRKKLVFLNMARPKGRLTQYKCKHQLLRLLDPIAPRIAITDIIHIEYLAYDEYNQRAVVTFSTWQVAKGVYAQKWKLHRAGVGVVRFFENTTQDILLPKKPKVNPEVSKPAVIITHEDIHIGKRPTQERHFCEIHEGKHTQSESLSESDSFQVPEEKELLRTFQALPNQIQESIINRISSLKDVLIHLNRANTEQVTLKNPPENLASQPIGSQEGKKTNSSPNKGMRLSKWNSAHKNLYLNTESGGTSINEEWLRRRFLTTEELGQSEPLKAQKKVSFQDETPKTQKYNGSIFIDVKGQLNQIAELD